MLQIGVFVRLILRFQLGIPVQIIHPAFMKMVWWEFSPIIVQFVNGRLEWHLPGLHVGLRGHPPAFTQITGRARGHNVLPRCLPAVAAWHQMVKCQIFCSAAILAFKVITQEHVKPRKCRVHGRLDVFLEADNTWNPHGKRGRVHLGIIFCNDVDPVEEDRLDRILPRPERKRIVT